MWDNAPLMRGIANFLFGVSLLLILVGTARWVLRLPVFQLRAVELTVVPQRVSAEQIKQMLHEQIRGNFFSVDLDRTRQVFEKLPWVRKVSVRRIFPWSLQVEVEEHVALARWNGTAMVNTYGEVFTARADDELPAFIGQPDTSAQVTQLYVELNVALQPMQQKVAQISLSPRFAWQVKLGNGMVLELGREQMQQRLERFVKVYPYSLADSAQTALHVDLRYRNGFAAYQPGSEV